MQKATGEISLSNGSPATVYKTDSCKSYARPECYRCGRKGHLAAKCKFRTLKCHQYGKISHVKAVCLSGKISQKHDRPKAIKVVQEVAELDSDDLLKEENGENQLFVVTDTTIMPTQVDLLVDNQLLQMEIDTGARLFHLFQSPLLTDFGLVDYYNPPDS